MKKLIFLFAAFLMMAGFTSRVMAQMSDTKPTQSNAELISAITLTNLLPLEFGGISNPGGTSSTVVMDTVGNRIATGVAVPLSTAITPSGAKYWVTGTANTYYDVSVPTFTIHQISNTLNTMQVHDLTISNFLFHRLLNSSGADEFRLGATLDIGANQVSANYTGSFNVTVAY
jgi:hypothetical protein